MIIKRQYLDYEKSNGFIMMKVLNPSYANDTIPFDVFEAVHNPGESGALFIPTRVMVTRNQGQKGSCENPGYPCDSDEDCDTGTTCRQGNAPIVCVFVAVGVHLRLSGPPGLRFTRSTRAATISGSRDGCCTTNFAPTSATPRTRRRSSTRTRTRTPIRCTTSCGWPRSAWTISGRTARSSLFPRSSTAICRRIPARPRSSPSRWTRLPASTSSTRTTTRRVASGSATRTGFTEYV